MHFYQIKNKTKQKKKALEKCWWCREKCWRAKVTRSITMWLHLKLNCVCFCLMPRYDWWLLSVCSLPLVCCTVCQQTIATLFKLLDAKGSEIQAHNAKEKLSLQLDEKVSNIWELPTDWDERTTFTVNTVCANMKLPGIKSLKRKTRLTSLVRFRSWECLRVELVFIVWTLI